MLSVYLLIIFLTRCALSIENGAVDCSMGSRSCESCRAAYPFCYWCEGQCRKYYGKSIAQIDCAGEVMYENCNRNNEKARLSKMLQLLESLKQRHHSSSGLSLPSQNQWGESYQPLIKPTESAKKTRLLRVLKLLKLLAVLEAKKKKNKNSLAKTGGIYNEFEHEYLGKMPLENNKEANEKFVQPNSKVTHKSETDSDLDALLKMIEVKTTEVPEIQKTTNVEIIQHTTSQNTRKPMYVTKGKKKKSHKTSTNVPFKKTEQLKISTKVFNSSFFTSKPTTISRNCELFETEDQCNSDRECSWCNILGECLGRTKQDFQYCTGNEKRSQLEEGYDPNDECVSQNDCKSCTGKGKCYWCEKTKSCHTYPFFGFIPHNCPANMWYYKECDVQLAIFIILFPLLLILLSMVIFYFCLRYCYYRKRTLKVQLFEKPELFERRKGKKVYFVGGDEDDDESRTEQIRKKYNLPHEKEPLISP